MTENILNIFKESEAILSGHFILSSGLHSDGYVQCAKLLMDPAKASIVCGELANKIHQIFNRDSFDIVLSPAMGGVIVGYELARQLGLQSIFCERVDGEFILRRGFDLKEGSRVLVVEDVITTGKSSLETFKVVEKYGAKVVAEACLIDRSAGESSKMGVPVIELLKLDIKTYNPKELPEHLQNIPAVKPGSRFINSTKR